MRTVITHFFNEEYLLPWWLKHHLPLFDHGVLIDHGSTDNSADICRQLAPGWTLVKSRLTEFDAWLTDFEVMNFELQITGWKFALNITEFAIANPCFEELQRFLKSENRHGVAASGFTMIDKAPNSLPSHDLSLPAQKPWAVDDNRFGRLVWLRQALGHPKSPQRNRFFHCLPTGMYVPGRHRSYHHDWCARSPNLMVLHYAYSPWNSRFVERKMQIGAKVPEVDKVRGVGFQHMRGEAQLARAFNRFDKLSYVDLREHRIAGAVLNSLAESSAIEFSLVPN